MMKGEGNHLSRSEVKSGAEAPANLRGYSMRQPLKKGQGGTTQAKPCLVNMRNPCRDQAVFRILLFQALRKTEFQENDGVGNLAPSNGKVISIFW